MLRIRFSGLQLRDALDLAILIEDEARERYVEFSKLPGAGGSGEVASFFSRMAAFEARHGEELSAARRGRFREAAREVTRSMFSNVEAPAWPGPSAGLSLSRALELALQAETKAFDFYDGALAHVEDAEVRALFQKLRAEEAQHQEAVRQQLRRLAGRPEAN